MLKRKMEEVLGMLDFLGSEEVPVRRGSRFNIRACACHGVRHEATGGVLQCVIDDGTETRQYTRDITNNTVHNGQLKLLVSEIEFLTPYKGSNYTVIYAGAAPGVHIVLLAKMFESMNFVLVDPSKSFVGRFKYPNVKVHALLMTDQLASALKSRYGETILFISDVRTGPPEVGREDDKAQQRRIHRDMVEQSKWFRRLDPVAGLFKFRLPWDLETHTKYLDGSIHFPIFGRFLTHESRLVVLRGATEKTYDNRQYEGHMAYFNQVLRGNIYEPTGRCYDCAAFRQIIMGYLGKTEVDTDVEKLCGEIESEIQTLKDRWTAIVRRDRL